MRIMILIMNDEAGKIIMRVSHKALMNPRPIILLMIHNACHTYIIRIGAVIHGSAGILQEAVDQIP
ncbi:hypothetical protein D3C76_1465470 [compost metagenome]